MIFVNQCEEILKFRFSTKQNVGEFDDAVLTQI